MHHQWQGTGDLFFGHLNDNFQSMDFKLRTQTGLNYHRTTQKKYSKVQDHRDEKELCSKDIMTHFWDLSKSYL